MGHQDPHGAVKLCWTMALILFYFSQNTNTGGPKQWAQLNGKAVEQDGESYQMNLSHIQTDLFQINVEDPQLFLFYYYYFSIGYEYLPL